MSRRTIAYQPALDGTRALAVSAVLLFHGGVGWMSGGYLGVSVFFTLSGFLITSLLLSEHERHGRIDVAAFYTRRARRLLPASMVCLVAVSAMAWAGWFEGVANLRRDVLGALFQVFNWVKLGAGESYADLFAATAGLQRPLDHYWSLAIEEQFYWIWPLTFMGLLSLSRRFRVRPLVSVGVLTALSAVAAPIIAHVWSADAAYWATPARICEILAGALVACWLSGHDVSSRMAWLAPGSLVLLAAGCVLFAKGSGPAYEGALPLVALCSAALIVGLQAEGPARQLLSVAPLVGLGKISYGVYLYHWPVFVLVDRQGWDVPAAVELMIKCAIAVTAAVVSYFLIERPIRTANWLPPRRTLVAALGGTAVAGVLAWLIIPTMSTYYGVDKAAAEQAAFDTGPVDSLVPLPPTVASSPAPETAVPGSTAASVTSLPVVTTTTELPVPSRPVRVVVVGDSTAEATGAGLVAWAAAHPQYAQVELVTGLGCGLVTRGYLDIPTGRVDVAPGCGPYVNEYVPERVAALRPDVVMVMSTVWDVLDRSLTPDGPFLTPLDSEIRELITDSFASFTDMLLGLGVPRVVWIQAPPPLPAAFGGEDQQADPARHEVMHTVIAQICAQRPATRVVDLAGWLVEQGLANSRDARRDGTHFTSETALGIATRFLGPCARAGGAVMSQHTNTTVFTDGACAGNPGRGGWAWAVAPGGEPCGSGGAAHTTNQRMELQAVLEALRALPGELTIVSDSTYVVHCFRDKWWVKWKANGWKNSQKQPVANTDIWMPLVELVQQRQPTFRWVKGHSGDPMNDLVDRLAVEASKGPFDAPAPSAAPEPPAQSSLFD